MIEALYRQRRLLLAVAAGVYAFLFRVHGISEHFQLFGDQMRDWRIVQSSFFDLPLAGTPRFDGGVSYGPVFYWVLWLSARLFTPFYGSLPHAGGMGIALFCAIALAVFYFELLRQTSFAVATVGFLLAASSPWEASFSGATAWNPSVATALAQLAIAFSLNYWRGPRPGSLLMASASAWLAFCAHFPAIFVSIAVFMVLAASAILKCGAGVALRNTAMQAALVLVLQAPYFVYLHRALDSDQSGVAFSIHSLLQDPSLLRTTAAYRYLVNGAAQLLLEGNLHYQHARTIIVASWLLAIGACWKRPQWAILSIGVLFGAWAGYAAWRMQYELYFQVALVGSYALSAVAALHWIASRVAILPNLVLVLLLCQQAGRWDRAPVERLPEYGTLLRAANDISRMQIRVASVEAPFADQRTRIEWFLELYGVELHSTGRRFAIEQDGTVREIEH
ncbi:MAG: hypothetical protein K1X75_10410 [Leptospirales bacterium]|nr:hypothetical protein [Leptospirales bacterium]